MDTKTILIVDDEEAVLYVLKNSLLKLGHDIRILTAQTADNALKYLEKYQVDLLITDYRMPGMNGLELLETVHNVQPNTRVIFMTAFGSEKVEAEVNRLNSFAYLNKPLNLATFREVVKQALSNLSIRRPGVVVQYADLSQRFYKILTNFNEQLNPTFVLFYNQADDSYVSIGETERLTKDQTISFVKSTLSRLDRGEKVVNTDAADSRLRFLEIAEGLLLAGYIGENQVFLSLLTNESINGDRPALLEKITSTLNKLKETILSAEEVKKESVFDIGFNTAVMGELDKLFSSEAEDESGNSDLQLSEPQKQAAMAAFSLSYDEALAVGLILPNKNSENE
jgi:CheY-like chemotaxis protein